MLIPAAPHENKRNPTMPGRLALRHRVTTKPLFAGLLSFLFCSGFWGAPEGGCAPVRRLNCTSNAAQPHSYRTATAPLPHSYRTTTEQLPHSYRAATAAVDPHSYRSGPAQLPQWTRTATAVHAAMAQHGGFSLPTSGQRKSTLQSAQGSTGSFRPDRDRRAQSEARA